MAKTKTQIRVLLADDHAIFREGLRKLLDSDEDITIVGEAQNGAERGKTRISSNNFRDTSATSYSGERGTCRTGATPATGAENTAYLERREPAYCTGLVTR